VSKAVASTSGAPHCKVMLLVKNTRSISENLPGTNTLAFCRSISDEEKKSFIALDTEVNVIKLFYSTLKKMPNKLDRLSPESLFKLSLTLGQCLYEWIYSLG
jgi:hypothetical protein